MEDGEPDIGVVVIGRNEGERLRRCLESVCGKGVPVVYVDSGSSDGSADLARSMCCEVVELDPSRPFAAPRARNEGFEHLCRTNPHVRLVQFVDGDCILNDCWLHTAGNELRARPSVGILCGRLREIHAEVSIYKRLAAMEWDQPTGEVRYVGGIFMIRRCAFEEACGFRSRMIAGEEPELCIRLRQRGWKIIRIDAEMTLHDAAMTRFGQWWKRAVRSGHAFAEGAWMYGASRERHGVRAVRSFVFWGAFVPVIAFGGAWITHGASLVLLLGYLLLWYRVARGQRARGHSKADARLYATFILISKFAELYGGLLFLARRIFGRPSRLIEYKSAPAALDRQTDG